MITLGYLLLAAGIGLTLWFMVHNVRRHRILRELPQAAPRRIGPELHLIATLFTGAGVWLAWDWQTALMAMVPQGFITAAIVIDMMEQNRRT